MDDLYNNGKCVGCKHYIWDRGRCVSVEPCANGERYATIPVGLVNEKLVYDDLTGKWFKASDGVVEPVKETVNYDTCSGCKYATDDGGKCSNQNYCAGDDLYEPRTPNKEMVDHPDHYNKYGMEAIDVIKAFTEDLNGVVAFDTGNIIKYILRWNDKNGIEDLKKVQWYTNHLIEYLEGENNV